MLIILILFASSFVIIHQIESKELRKIVIQRYLYGLLFQSFFLILYRLELSNMGRQVYFSDAEVYWEHTLSYISGYFFSAYNDVYIWLSYFIQITSPNIWVGWNNIFNILLLNLTILMCAVGIYKAMTNKSYSATISEISRNIRIFLNITLFNPLILYSLMRNLKDATYLFLVVILIYIFLMIYNKKSTIVVLLFALFSIFMMFVLYGVRPWGFISSFFVLFLLINHKNKSWFKRLIWILIIFSLALVISFLSNNFNRIISSTLIWIPIVINNFMNASFFNRFTAIPRLFIGPGPIRSIQGSDYFLYYTQIGNIMSFFGSVIWWIQLSFMLAIIFDKKYQSKYSDFSKYMFWNLISFVMVYSLAYSGSSELRFRGVLYILFSALFFSFYKVRFSKAIIFKSTIFLIVIVMGGFIYG
jgi:hypothetical protein